MESLKNSFPSKHSVELKDDFELLSLMLKDSKEQPPLFQPGKYWSSKAKNAEIEIKKFGIGDFRGSSNQIGLSYADNQLTDIRNTFNFGLKSRLIQWLTRTYPLNKVFDLQVRWTESYADQNSLYAQEILNQKSRTRDLLKKFSVPYSLLGNCHAKAQIDGEDYSIHYLNLLDQHDYISSHINFNNAKSVFEIGGGFGANIHLLLHNYKSIKKILYLDIPPNLYVGSQYLKAFYGSAVTDYSVLRHIDTIKFNSDDSLQIFCIAPWQIENFKSQVDIFLNSHSFVEMPSNIVKNYCDCILKFPESHKTKIALTTYDCYDLNTTLSPNELPDFFKEKCFEYFEQNTILDSTRKNLYYVTSESPSLKKT